MADPLLPQPGFAPFDAGISMMVNADILRDEELDAKVRETREHFNAEPGYTYEDFVGRGAYGIACRVQQKGSGARPPRKMIVKRALNDFVEGELQNEIRVMGELNGSAHIASVIASKDSIGKPPQHFLEGLAGPALVLEYLGNGVLDKLRQQAPIRDVHVPNRILWAIFLCLVRACVAMKYAPGASPDSEPKLEELPVPPPSRIPDGYRHGDLHLGNMMFGSTGDFPEHSIIPPVKLIDFGLAEEHERSVPDNLLGIATNVLWLIIGGYVPLGAPYAIHKGKPTMGGVLLPNPVTGEDPLPWLDRDLRNIILECMARREEDRPSLEKVLNIAKEAVGQRGAEFYGPQESDGAIQYFIQTYVYDANMS
ncbi:hypothetical protein GQX73_g10149 [Xylaria multiplex]|uniref:Protein kinase domain-containing protein n=1 Tax=Xylaria multiplex TaxID=323545 RepID=A0A7C8IKL4_9PEZI|nr:hypothetical protein GQX73_g10149 [Xylaria multiplex]